MRADHNTTEDLFIKITYRTEDYEEITNLKKFNGESMFSQVGGFIGIMLGVSLFHIPDILKSVISRGKTVYNGWTRNENQEAANTSYMNS